MKMASSCCHIPTPLVSSSSSFRATFSRYSLIHIFTLTFGLPLLHSPTKIFLTIFQTYLLFLLSKWLSHFSHISLNFCKTLLHPAFCKIPSLDHIHLVFLRENLNIISSAFSLCSYLLQQLFYRTAMQVTPWCSAASLSLCLYLAVTYDASRPVSCLPTPLYYLGYLTVFATIVCELSAQAIELLKTNELLSLHSCFICNFLLSHASHAHTWVFCFLLTDSHSPSSHAPATAPVCSASSSLTL